MDGQQKRCGWRGVQTASERMDHDMQVYKGCNSAGFESAKVVHKQFRHDCRVGHIESSATVTLQPIWTGQYMYFPLPVTYLCIVIQFSRHYCLMIT